MAKKADGKPPENGKAQKRVTGGKKKANPNQKGHNGTKARSRPKRFKRKAKKRTLSSGWGADALAVRDYREWVTHDEMLALREDVSQTRPRLIHYDDMDSEAFHKMFQRLKAFLDAELEAERRQRDEVLSIRVGSEDAPYLITPKGVQKLKQLSERRQGQAKDKRAEVKKPPLSPKTTLDDVLLEASTAVQPPEEADKPLQAKKTGKQRKPKPDSEQAYFKSVWPEAAQAREAVEAYEVAKTLNKDLPDPGDFTFDLQVRPPTVADVQKLLSYGINVGVLYPRSKVSLPWKELQYSKLPEDTSFWKAILWGHVGISVILGRVSGNLVCVDCDTKAAFYNTIAAFKRQGSPLFAVRSAKGGHVYFQGDGEIENIPEGKLFWKNGRPAENIAIWGHSRYMVVPPSLHPSGYPYWWFMGNTTDRPPQISLIDDTEKKGVLSAIFADVAYRVRPNGQRTFFDVKKRKKEGQHPLKNVYSYLETPIAPGNRNNSMIQALVAVYKWVDPSTFRNDLVERIRQKGLSDGLAPSHVNGMLDWAEWTIEPNKDGMRITGASTGLGGVLDLSFEDRNLVWKHKRAQLFLDFYQFRGRGMLTDRAVAVSMLELARRSDSGYWRGSVREVAELARMPYRTAHDSLKRLEALEIIKRMGLDKRSGAITWGWGRRTLGIGPFFDFFDALIHRTDQSEIEQARNSSRRYLKSLDDLSEAIGKAARFILEMCNGESLSRDEIAQRTNLTISQVRRAMTGLGEAGLAEYDRGKNQWTIERFLEEDSDLLAVAAGTYGNGLKRKQEHAEERMWYVATKILVNRFNRMGLKKRQYFAAHILKSFHGHPKEQYIRNLLGETRPRPACADCGDRGWVWFMIDDGVTHMGVETMAQVPCRSCEPESFAVWMLSMGPGWDEYFDMRQSYDLAADFEDDFGYITREEDEPASEDESDYEDDEEELDEVALEEAQYKAEEAFYRRQAELKGEDIDAVIWPDPDLQQPPFESYFRSPKRLTAAEKAAKAKAEAEAAQLAARQKAEAQASADLTAKIKANQEARAREKAAAEKAARDEGRELPTTFPPKPESLRLKRDRRPPSRPKSRQPMSAKEGTVDFEAYKANRLYGSYEEFLRVAQAILDGEIELTDEMIVKDSGLRRHLLSIASRREHQLEREKMAKLAEEEQKAIAAKLDAHMARLKDEAKSDAEAQSDDEPKSDDNGQ